MSSSKTTTTTGAGAGAGVVDVLDGIIGLTPSLREEEGREEDVGGRKRGEVDDGDDDDGGDAGAGRKRARFDPTRDTVLVVPARQKKEDSGRPPTGEELLALAEEEASDRTALVFEPTLRGARQACKSLDRALRRNRASRDEHPDDPAKFVDDEVALNDAVLCLKDAAADVGLYPELVECGMADSLLTLLGHENVDVAAGAVEVLAELLDPSLLLVVVASGDDDGNGGGNAPSSSSSGGRAGCVASLANAFVDGGGLDLLSSNLGRLDESVDEESRCAEEVLALVESLLDLDRAGALGRGRRRRRRRWRRAPLRRGVHMRADVARTVAVRADREDGRRPGGGCGGDVPPPAGLAEAALVGGPLRDTAARGLLGEHARAEAGGATEVRVGVRRRGWRRRRGGRRGEDGRRDGRAAPGRRGPQEVRP